jgi:membrane peptidoglycan carboxypeptidase
VVAGNDGKVIAENRPVPHQVLTEAENAVLTSILERVVSEGTGRRAALKDRPAAGKTGTTENYGDAWFVGYTPQLVTAVWIGYPNKLVPMLTQYHGGPVSGSTFPAEIWNTFMASALRRLGEAPESFPSPPPLSVTPKLVVWRNGKLRLDNGYCKQRSEVVYFTGKGPTVAADCKPNEVEVPRVIGLALQPARERLALQPLTPKVVYKPAEPKQRPGIVVNQFPRRGFLSTYDTVTLVVTKPVNGVVPDVVGDTLGDAREKLRKLKLRPRLMYVAGPPGRIVSQAPRAGVAAAPGLVVTLAVARG